jgi:CubicO group peptidase (beta-lactamase class C family)
MKKLLLMRRSISHALTLLFVCLACLLSVSAQQSAPKDLSELEKTLQDELKSSNTPGAALAIVSGDRVIYARGFGLANIETCAPVTPLMLFRLGSTTKMFTGAALVALAAQGKIKLDEPIGNYAKGLNPKLARITAHQLISNTGGMADFEAEVVSNDDDALARMVRAWKEDAQFTEPGQIYSYASPGFWLAGYVIEEVTGQPYADAMNELVFQPLGMERTTLRPLMALTYPLAMGHSASEKEKPVILHPAYNNVAQWPTGKYVNGPQTWEVFVKDGKLYLKQEGGDAQLSKSGAYRLSFGAELENDLAFVPNARGEIEYIFDGLYSGKKTR